MLEQYLSLLTSDSRVQAIIIAATFLILAKIFTWVSKNIFKRYAAKTKTDVDDKLLAIAEKPVAILITLIGIKLAVNFLDIEAIIQTNIQHIINTFIIIAATYAGVLIAEIIFDMWARKFAKKTKSHVDDELLPIINTTIKVLFYIIGFIIILHEWGVNIIPFLTSLGIAGLAVGLALQQTLANIFGGIAMIIDRNIRVGDVIKISGRAGVIHQIGLRTTRMRTFDNDMLIIPNSEMANSIIENYAQPGKDARASFSVGVAYGTNPDKVKKTITQALGTIKEIDKEPAPMVVFKEMADSSLNFDVYFWVKDYTMRFATKDKAITATYKALEKNKIEIPFPTRTVYMKK